MVSKRDDKKLKLFEYLNKYFKGEAEIVLGIFADLTFSVRQGEITVEIESRDIKDFDLVYFRNTLNSQSMAATLSIYLEYAGIKFFDRSFLNGSFTGDKFTSLMRLASNEVPIVPSFLCWKGSIERNKEKIVELFGYPIVAKEVTTQRMLSIYLIKSLDDFKNLPEKTVKNGTAKYLFQKFISIDKEFRILVLGDTVGVVHTKTVRDNSSFKLGYNDLNEYPEYLKNDAVSNVIKDGAVLAAKSLNIQIAGVDVCREKDTGKIYVIEVNRGPGFEYDTKISSELNEVAKFLQNKLNKDG